MILAPLVLAFFVNVTPNGAAAKPTPVRVYVYTAEATGGAPPEDQQGRLDSVRDLEDVLRHKSQFILSRSADEAQVVIEVVNREEREAPAGGFGGKSVTRFRETILRVRVRAGAEQGELKGVGQGSWKSAAKDLADRLTKWVRNHVAVSPKNL